MPSTVRANASMQTPGPPPPFSVQRAAAETINTPSISRLLSLSNSTPRSILSDKSSSTKEKKEDIQALMDFMNTLNFQTPVPSLQQRGVNNPAAQASQPSDFFLSPDTPTASHSGLPPQDHSSPAFRPPPGRATPYRHSSVFSDRTNHSASDAAPPQSSKESYISKDPFPKMTPIRKPLRQSFKARDPTPSRSLPQGVNKPTFPPATPAPFRPARIPKMTPQPPRTISHNVPDPPVNDSKLWLTSEESASMARMKAVDPEPTYVPEHPDESILLQTAFVDYDLAKSQHDNNNNNNVNNNNNNNNSHITIHFDETSFPDRYQSFEENNFSYGVDTPGVRSRALGVAPTFSITPTHSLVETYEHSTGPQTPQDAKEWLQTAMKTLEEAQAERASARQWANDMKEAVLKWTEEQRRLIKCETSVRFDELDERESRFYQHANGLSFLETMLQQLHHEFQSTQSSQRASEERLQTLLLDQHERIRTLSKQLSAMEQTVSKGIIQHQSMTPQSNNTSSGTSFPKLADTIKQGTTSATPSTASTSSRVREPLPGGQGYVVQYSSGVRKEVHIDGTIVVRFTNGDVETKFSGKQRTVAYFHAAEQVLQITSESDPHTTLLEYPNGQIERHNADGSKSIIFPDGTKAKISSDGKIETYIRT